MADLVSVDPTHSHVTGQPDGYAWFKFSDGRQYHRKLDRGPEVARSSFPAPAIRRDSIAPAMGMDGKMYESLAGLRKTYQPSGNPQGERYHELGNSEAPVNIPTFDRKQRRDDIRAAISDVKNGNVPPPAFIGD